MQSFTVAFQSLMNQAVQERSTVIAESRTPVSVRPELVLCAVVLRAKITAKITGLQLTLQFYFC